MIDDDTRAKIKEHYDKGQGSIQDIARVYRVQVADVLAIINAQDLATVELGGDLIDSTEAGPGATLNYGQIIPINYSTD